MIVLPALPAIIAALTPIVEAALIAAGIGALFGGATCAVGGAVSGYQEHGAISREVATETAQRAAECAAEGALVGGAFGVGGAVIAPVVAPALTLVDDVARPVIQVVDDAARPVIQVVDDATRPVLNNFGVVAHSAHMSTEKVVTTALKRVRTGLPAPIQRLLPKTTRSSGFVYVMDDTVSGARKIGLSIDPKRRLRQVENLVGNKVNLTCTIPTYNMRALESALHTAFASQRLPDTGVGTEWFKLTASQVSAICS